jgi:hypothetical protein
MAPSAGAGMTSETDRLDRFAAAALNAVLQGPGGRT